MAIGTCDGELYLYTIGSELPFQHASSLGGIVIVKFSWVSYFEKSVLVVICLESKCYFFDILSTEDEWNPLLCQSLLFNPSCCTIFEGKSGTEIILGTMHGGIGYFISDTNKKIEPVWKYMNIWNIGLEITSIFMMENGSVVVGRGDGTAIIFNVGEYPEVASSVNPITEANGKAGNYVLVSSNNDMNILATVNGSGKVSSFNYSKEGKITLIESKKEILIEKRSIFLGILKVDEKPIVVVGSSDGCLYFISKNISNFFRYEESVQGYFLSQLKRPLLVIVGQSGYISVYSRLTFLQSTVPKFVDFARAEIEELRKIIGDFDTPAEALVATYLYMPLPE